jgi:hypothetical protein
MTEMTKAARAFYTVEFEQQVVPLVAAVRLVW